ncbi:centrosomal protein kizuna isoform X3 [Coturnix japonica]|uniref:centrosomal protein kizuna isoform X3 n=1 Tax=Coturnix japonica TaxID=93934 RepID=UPI0007771608|nr:centrosomal protein kizuna isoform X3 [Coturnix japonica]
MSGAGRASGPEGSPSHSRQLRGLMRSLRDSETRRLQLERKLMEYKSSDAYLMKLKYVKLKKYLEEVNDRQKRALLRNQMFLNEFNEFEARVKASSSKLIEKMVRYGGEIKSGLSFQEGDLTHGDKEEGCNEQMPQAARQAGIHVKTAVSRRLHHPVPFFTGRCMSACSVQQEPPQPAACPSRLTTLRGDDTDRHPTQFGGDTERDNKPDEQGGKLGLPMEEMPIRDSSLHSSLLNFKEDKNSSELCSALPNGGRVQSSTADLASDTSVEEVMTHKHLVTSAKEVCEHPVLLAPAPEPSISGPQYNLNTQQAASQDDSSSSTHPAESSSLQLPSCCTAEDEPLGSSVSDGFCSLDGSLKEDLETSDLCELPRAKAGQQSDVATLKHEHLCTEELAAALHSTLDSGEEAPGSQAPPLLREVLAEECGDRSSVQSNESSYSLPSIPNDGREMEQAKHVPWLDGIGKQAGCVIGNNGSEVKESQEMCSERSSSSERSGDLSRPEFRKGAITAIKSKAFWGESDDSSSESLDVLRPQAHSPEADDFDDFYD